MTTRQQKGRLFVTGASGYIGSVVTEFAIAEGYDVHGLSRNEASDAKLQSLGALPVRGDLTSIDVLRDESAKADIVIHLATAFVLGGGGSYEDAKPIDFAAVDAIAEGLEGADKPLVVTSGSLTVAPDPNGGETTEESPPDPNIPIDRIETEKRALALAGRGIRVTALRLAPYVYGRGGSNIKRSIERSAQTGGVVCVNGGTNHTTVVHVDDAARLFLLAAQKGKAGELFNASSATDVTARQIFDAIATTLGVPVRDISYAEAQAKLGPIFAWWLPAENRASGAKAVKELGWLPHEIGVLDDISKGSYQAVAEPLRKAAA